MPPLIPQHKIFPFKGREAREYLRHLGCLIGSETITLPDHLKIVPLSGGEVTYAVMHDSNEVFRMQYHHLTNQWRIIVPVEHQVTPLELARSYGLNTLWNAGIFGCYGTMLQLMGGISIQRAIAIAVLKRLSDYTGHPYDLENVRIALAEEAREGERETNFARR